MAGRSSSSHGECVGLTGWMCAILSNACAFVDLTVLEQIRTEQNRTFLRCSKFSFSSRTVFTRSPTVLTTVVAVHEGRREHPLQALVQVWTHTNRNVSVLIITGRKAPYQSVTHFAQAQGFQWSDATRDLGLCEIGVCAGVCVCV